MVSRSCPTVSTVVTLGRTYAGAARKSTGRLRDLPHRSLHRGYRCLLFGREVQRRRESRPQRTRRRSLYRSVVRSRNRVTAALPPIAQSSSADRRLMPSAWHPEASLSCKDRRVPSRAPFLAMNRIVNPALKAILRSPIHGLASGRLALITYTGRRSGREYTLPCFY